jgi:hypothetical protein
LAVEENGARDMMTAGNVLNHNLFMWKERKRETEMTFDEEQR